MLVVADTSALIAIAACDALALLDQLFQEVRVPTVDDHRARKVARLNGMEIIGSLGMLLRAKEAGLIPEIRPLIAFIQTAGVHYGDQLVTKTLQLAGEI